ncbi:MAG: hypothetical protein AB1664_22235, partial [Thermodesulfobacteriota bacterium]
LHEDESEKQFTAEAAKFAEKTLGALSSAHRALCVLCALCGEVLAYSRHGPHVTEWLRGEPIGRLTTQELHAIG